MTLEDELRRAEHARRILNDELVIEAFRETERFFVETWMNSAAADTQERERAFMGVLGMRVFKNHFATILSNGAFAAHKLEAERQTED